MTGTSDQLKPVKSERSCRPRSGNPSARRVSAWTTVAARLLARVDVVRPAAAERGVENVRAAGARVGRAVRVDAQEERRAGAIRDAGTRDVAHARAGRLVRVMTTRMPAR